MPIDIEKEKVRALIAEGAILVDVLSANAYAKLHIAGAINIPLTVLDQKSTAALDPRRPVITYCYDYQ